MDEKTIQDTVQILKSKWRNETNELRRQSELQLREAERLERALWDLEAEFDKMIARAAKQKEPAC